MTIYRSILVAYFTFLSSLFAMAQSTLPQLSKLSFEQARTRVQALEQAISDKTPALSPKDQFETTEHYNQRKQQWIAESERLTKAQRAALEQLTEQFYVDRSLQPVFVKYDADVAILSVSIGSERNWGVFRIVNTEARDMYDEWNAVNVAYQWWRHDDNGRPLPPKRALAWRDKVYVQESPDYVNGIVVPQLIFKIEPKYSEAARKAKYQGTVTLSLVVRRDGTVGDVQVITPLGLGLDEKAIEAVKQWKYRPAIKDGEAQDMTITVEISFRLL